MLAVSLESTTEPYKEFGGGGGKFLKKLWCCAALVGVLQDNLVLSTELTM